MKHANAIFYILILLINISISASTALYITTKKTFDMVQTDIEKGDFTYFFPLLFQGTITPTIINNPDQNNATLLYWAVYYNNLPVVNTLLKNGAQSTILTPQYKNNTSPLDIAIANKNIPILEALISSKLLEDKLGFVELIEPKSSNPNQNLINNINKSSPEVQALFKNLIALFACDIDSEMITNEVNPTESTVPLTYLWTGASDNVECLQIPIDTVTTFTNLGISQLKIYTANGNDHYYIEAYNDAVQLLGTTNFNKAGTKNLIRFFNQTNQFVFSLSLPNLDIVIDAINNNKNIPTVLVSIPQCLCNISTQNNNPIIASMPLNLIVVYSLNGIPIIDAYLNDTLMNSDPLDSDLLTIVSPSNQNLSINDFIKNAFNAKKSTGVISYTQQSITTLSKINNLKNYSIIPKPPLFDIKTKNGSSIILLGSSTPFDEIIYTLSTKNSGVTTYSNGNLVIVDNFDGNNVIVSGEGKSVSLYDFIKNNNYTGTYYISPALPLFDIKTKDSTPITLINSEKPFNEIKYFILNGVYQLSAYLNNEMLTLDNFNLSNLSVVNSKTSIMQDANDFIAANNFNGSYYILPTPPLFDFKSNTGQPLTIIGMQESFDEIQGSNNNGSIELGFYLNKKPISVTTIITDNIMIMNGNTAIKPLTQYIQENNFIGSFTIAMIPATFDIKTIDEKPLKTLSHGSFDEIKYIGTATQGKIYTYLQGSYISIPDFDSSLFTVIDANKNSQSLQSFIQSNNYTGTYYIGSSPILFTAKSKKGFPLRLLGSTTLFDEIRYAKTSKGLFPYTYHNGGPITVDNFDANNIIITDQNGTTQLLSTYLQIGQYTDKCIIEAAPPFFTVKTPKDTSIRLLGSTTPFDEIKYFTLNNKPIIATYHNGGPITVDNFDANNVTIMDQNGTTQTLTAFIQKGNYKGTLTLSATPPLFDIKAQTIPIKITGTNNLVDEVKYFMLNGTPMLIPYLHGGPKNITNLNLATISITDSTNTSLQLLSDFINGNNYSGKFFLTATKK